MGPEGLFERHVIEVEELVIRRRNKGSSAIITTITPGDGLPEVIEVHGRVKCQICSGFCENSTVCAECKEAIMLLRAANNKDILRRLLNLLIERPYVVTVFEALSDEAISDYYLSKLQAGD